MTENVKKMTVPRCVRGAHWCAELCEVAHGQPCQPPAGEVWRPCGELRGFAPGSDVANYRVLVAELAGVELDDRQRQSLRWLAGWDGDTAAAIASLFRAARKRP